MVDCTGTLVGVEKVGGLVGAVGSVDLGVDVAVDEAGDVELLMPAGSASDQASRS